MQCLHDESAPRAQQSRHRREERSDGVLAEQRKVADDDIGEPALCVGLCRQRLIGSDLKDATARPLRRLDEPRLGIQS